MSGRCSASMRRHGNGAGRGSGEVDRGREAVVVGEGGDDAEVIGEEETAGAEGVADGRG